MNRDGRHPGNMIVASSLNSFSWAGDDENWGFAIYDPATAAIIHLVDYHQ